MNKEAKVVVKFVTRRPRARVLVLAEAWAYGPAEDRYLHSNITIVNSDDVSSEIYVEGEEIDDLIDALLEARSQLNDVIIPRAKKQAEKANKTATRRQAKKEKATVSE